MSLGEHSRKWKTRLRNPSILGLLGFNLLAYCMLLKWLIESIQYDKVIDQLQQIPAWAVLGSLAINLATLAVYGVRMSVLLGKDFRVAFAVVNIGYALNTLIPLRLGEALKIYLCKELFGINFAGLISASAAEKLVDLLKLLLIGLVFIAFTAGELIRSNLMLLLVCFVVIGSCTLFLLRFKIVWFVKLLPKGGRFRRFLIELHNHVASYPIGYILMISGAIWILNIFLLLFTFNNFLIDLHIDILDAMGLLLIIALAISIPAAPAGIGMFEAGIVAYLTQKFGVDNESALAAAVVFHLVITIPQLVISGCLIVIRNLNRGPREPV